jgi:hypothetical protein
MCGLAAGLQGVPECPSPGSGIVRRFAVPNHGTSMAHKDRYVSILMAASTGSASSLCSVTACGMTVPVSLSSHIVSRQSNLVTGARLIKWTVRGEVLVWYKRTSRAVYAIHRLYSVLWPVVAGLDSAHCRVDS